MNEETKPVAVWHFAKFRLWAEYHMKKNYITGRQKFNMIPDTS
jgi:hypothetical protein